MIFIILIFLHCEIKEVMRFQKKKEDILRIKKERKKYNPQRLMNTKRRCAKLLKIKNKILSCFFNKTQKLPFFKTITKNSQCILTQTTAHVTYITNGVA